MSTTKTTTAPAAAAIITHKVADYGAWRSVFDGHGAARKKAGLLGHHINRRAEDPNTVAVYVTAATTDAIRAFGASEGLRDVMKRGGVVGEPTIVLMSPQEDRTVHEPSPGAIVVHDVKDYAVWKRVFDEHDAMRKKAGLIGYAVSRSAEKPNTVVVYLQAGSIDQIRAFAGSADLKATMERAGVVGSPRITFVQGLDWASYA
jgi:quinol monooxygenase YgiN/heme-degrading monooxygenase HmoA